MDSPILLNTTTTVSPGAMIEANDPTKLQNPFKTAMLLDEIRFFLPSLYAPSPQIPVNLRLSIQVDFRLGRVPLTNGPVSISCFAPNKNDQTRFSYAAGALTPYVWRLPRPLYLLPEEYLIPRVYHNPIFGTTGARDLEIMYVGRSLPADYPRPQVRHHPYVAQAPLLTAALPSSGDTLVQTSEADLVNPFDVPLKVQRFVGDFYNSVDFVNPGSAPTTDDWAGELTMMRAVDHRGGILVKDPTPFPSLISFPDRSWPVDTVLEPKGFFIFFLERNYSGLAGAACVTAPVFSMVGYRTERF